MKENGNDRTTLYLNNQFNQSKLPATFWEAQVAPLQLSYVSQTLAQTLPGLPSGQSNFWNFIHPKDQSFVKQSHIKALKNKLPQTIEYQIYISQDNSIWVRDTFEIQQTHDDKVILRGVLTNIEEEKRQKTLLKTRKKLIEEIVQVTAHKHGQDFFEQIVISLSTVLKAEYVLIGERSPDNKIVHTIACCEDGRIIPNFSYELAGTPCQFVVDKNTCIHPDQVAQKFPQDIMLADLNIKGYLGTPVFDKDGRGLGLIVAMYKTPIKNASTVSSLFELFSGRIGAEINRVKADTALIQNKQALLKEKLFVDSIIQNATEGICVCHETEEFPYVKFTMWNQQMEQITGYTMQEINELGWYQTVYPDEATSQKAAARMQEMRHGKNLIRETWMVTPKAGSPRILEISTTMVNNEDNMPHVLGIMKDVTETQKAKQALETRQSRMHLLYQITSNVSREIDEQLQQALKLTTEFFSAETSFISYIDQNDFLITNSYSTTGSLPVGTHHTLDETICVLTYSKEKVVMIDDLDKSPLKKELSPIDFDTKSYIGALVYVFGKKYGSICITSSKPYQGFNDIDAEFVNLLSRWAGNLIERKLKEQDLRTSEERYRLLTESAPVGIALHVKGIIKYMNPYGAQMLEATSSDQLLEVPVSRILHPDSLEVAATRIQELNKRKGSFAKPIEEQFITLNGATKDFVISGIAIDHDGELAVCNVFADITELKQAEQELVKRKEQLERYNKELEELAYVASHDLKAPLANFQGLMMLMESEEAIKAQGKEYFAKMKLAVTRMQNTLHNLNEVINMKQVTGEKENILFEQIFNEVITSLETQISEAHAIIICDFSQVPSVLYPLIQLKSIIQNLLTNAIKYRHPERQLQIDISTTQANNQICLIVSDNGLGMDLSKSKEKPFGLFKRLHNHVEGKGMGLYIIKSIVDSHLGAIDVESKVNLGTTFKIYLGNE